MKAIDRFYKYLAEKSLKPTTIEKEIGLSNGYLSAQKKRSADMGESVLLKIIDNFRDINPLWLLTGEGNMLKGINDKKEAEFASQNLPDNILIGIIEKKDNKIEELSKELGRLENQKEELLKKLSHVEEEDVEDVSCVAVG